LEIAISKVNDSKIARAAISKPQLILLDEPMAGLNAEESRK